jgi:hypothetical protein
MMDDLEFFGSVNKSCGRFILDAGRITYGSRMVQITKAILEVQSKLLINFLAPVNIINDHTTHALTTNSSASIVRTKQTTMLQSINADFIVIEL